ncbi:MAG: hypothetical protein KDC07_11690 [Chitinophagaceae bacterium]|nr:hypothetical protein [Chitinophagaceae bacterium]MCB9045488.1 hypothetical protein [Chitinophagales bacterium]
MGYDHDASWERLETLLKSKKKNKEKWSDLVDYHFSKEDAIGLSLKDINIEKDVEELRDWITKLFRTEPIPPNTDAIWIGVFKATYENREIYASYCIGSTQYTESNIEWATEPTYMPENRYFVIDGVNELLSIINDSDDRFAFLDWILPLGYYCFILSDIVVQCTLYNDLLPDGIHIVCGYDEGDYIELT